MLNFAFISISFIIAFSVTFVLLPFWIRYAKKIGLVGRDMNKPAPVMVAEAGGVIVVGAIIVSLLYFAGITVFHYNRGYEGIVILGAIGSIVCAAIIGIFDDVRGWKIGLTQWQKPLLTIPAAIPFLLTNLQRTTIDIPFIGVKNVGLVLPLVFIPMAIVGAANAFNMLAGYNGLEAGMGLLILGVFSVLSYLNGQSFAAVLCLIGFSALLAFMIFNWYPAKVFPGDTMTYPIGAFLAIGAIAGRIEKFALILFIPYFLDFLLPLRKKMKVEAFAKVNSDGSLEQPYEGIYDTVHLVIFFLQRIKKKVYERDIVAVILGFEAFLAVVCVAIAVLTRR
jgi:UDP-N-acetylglucosamine--dolichyl-phosphate N-acetylglucosaminephosphotransferase